MEKYIFALLFIDSFIRVFFRVKPVGLCCGLFGFNGSKPPDLHKLKVLGLYNQSRGIHSCGVWFNNVLTKGIDKQKLFSDFLQDVILKGNKDSKTFIGHTRQATYGQHTLENAHPFNINDRMVLAHNGTIKNIWTLCRENDIDAIKITVDSLALGLLIDKVGLTILEEYEGFAALLYQKKDEPNSLYVYHGASRDKKGGTEFEERPMYFMRTKEGIYFSSMEGALKAIRVNEKEVPEILPHNIVYKVTDGDFTGEKVRIDRGDCNIEPPKVTNYYSTSDYKRIVNSSGNNTQSFIKTPDKDKNLKPIIFLETKPASSEKEDGVFYFKGRYWENRKDAQGDRLCHGLRYINKKAQVTNIQDKHGIAYFFWKGVMLNDIKDFNDLQKLNNAHVEDMNDSYNFAMFMSKYSRYPISNLENEGANVGDQWRFCWYLSGDPVDVSFTPKFSQRHYHVTRGVLMKISTCNKKESPLLKSVTEENKPETSVQLSIIVPNKSDIEKAVDELFPVIGGNDCCTLGHNLNTKVIDMRSKAKDNSVVIVDQKQENEYNDIYSPQVQSVAKLLRVVYPDVDSVYSDVGETGIQALTFYVSHLYEELSDDKSERGQEELARDLNYYLDECVSQRITLEEGMVEGEKWVLPLEDYIQMAIDQAVKESSEIDEEIEQDLKGRKGNDFEYDSDKQKLLDDAEAVDMMESVIGYISELYGRSDDLQTLNESDMAQDLAFHLYRELDSLRTNLKQILFKHKEKECAEKLDKIVNVTI